MVSGKHLAAFLLSLLLLSSILLLFSSDVHSSSENKASFAEAMPTREPTKTPPAIPGQTDAPTPVDSDYMPALFAMNSTPTATPTVSLELPTQGSARTTIPLPH